ncbi:D-alanyl-D-alanine carboxypeptidase family protein [Halanaerobaculum tunisiense]
MEKLKRGVSLCLIFVFLLLPTTIQAKDFDVKAKSAVLMDVETGQVLFNKQPNLELPPASITKLMTILLTMEAIDKGEVSLNDQVEVSALAESMGGSQIWLKKGETVQLKDLLKAIVIPSANDACVALAEHVGGTESNFIKMINNRATELGLEHTHFVNTTGLPTPEGEHYSSAHDIAVMAREIITKHSKILEWSSKRVDYIKDGEQPLYTTNQLIDNYANADGLKTGWTEEADYCLVGTAKRGDRRLIGVVMGTESEEARVEETSSLLNYGFRAFQQETLVNAGIETESAPVHQGVELEVPLETATSFEPVIQKGTKEEIKQEVNLTKELQAPVEQGQVAGELVFTYQEEKVGEVDLVTTQEVEKAGIFTLLFRWLKNFVFGFFE